MDYKVGDLVDLNPKGVAYAKTKIPGDFKVRGLIVIGATHFLYRLEGLPKSLDFYKSEIKPHVCLKIFQEIGD